MHKLNAQRRNFYFFSLIVLIYTCITAIWNHYSTATWDDDANTRYFLVLDASENPRLFFNAWVRPLYAMLFYYPQQALGKLGVVALMSTLNILAAWALFKVAIWRKLPMPWIIACTYLFQTFLFGISRDAMTEPIAAFLIAISIYFMYSKQYYLFVVAGAFIPLARAELVFLWIFWAFFLIKEKKIFLIPLLGIGLGIWWLGLFIQTGNFMEFIKEITVSGEKANRYQRVPVSQYFSKLVYTVGPVFCFFLWPGFIAGLKRFKSNYFYHAQFLFGLVLYTVFATLLDIGQSAGFLRNIITLAPFAALIIYDGILLFLNAFLPIKNEEEKPIEEKKIAITEKNGKKTASVKKGNDLAAENKAKPYFSAKLLLWIYSGIFILFSLKEYSQKLFYRQYYDPEVKDYTIIYYIFGTVALLFIIKLFEIKQWLATIAIILLQLSFTLTYENPESHDNDERAAIRNISHYLTSINGATHLKVYCNHAWYNWITDTKMSDTARVQHLDSTTLKKVKYGEFVLWESHYNSENYSKLSLDTILNKKDFVPIYLSSTKKNLMFCLLTKDSSKSNVYDKYLAKTNADSDPGLLIAKAFHQYYYSLKPQEAEATLAHFIRQEDELPFLFYFRGAIRLTLNKKNDACADLLYSAQLGNLLAADLYKKTCSNLK